MLLHTYVRPTNQQQGKTPRDGAISHRTELAQVISGAECITGFAEWSNGGYRDMGLHNIVHGNSTQPIDFHFVKVYFFGPPSKSRNALSALWDLTVSLLHDSIVVQNTMRLII